MKKVRIALTGATGLLGRNLLFEFMKQYINELHNLEVIILGREKGDISLKERIKNILLDDGVYYISSSKDLAEKLLYFLETGIKYVDMDFVEEKLGISDEDYKFLRENCIDIFFHLGGLVDLRGSNDVEKQVVQINLVGTFNLLEIVRDLKVGEFCYIGTAYSCGKISGVVEPDFISNEDGFRNPYEEAKLESEILVRTFAQKENIKYRIFRPSVVCGRLMEKPLGSISKYDVFYGWGAFFLHVKKEMVRTPKDLYSKPVSMNVRVCFNDSCGLNIVPVDYISKVMFQVCMNNVKGESFHLVSDRETPHSFYLLEMIKSFNIQGVKHVNKIPDDQNQVEKFYYKTVGRIFTPYINQEEIIFSTQNLQSIFNKAHLSCPIIDEKNMGKLIDYAKKDYFGLKG